MPLCFAAKKCKRKLREFAADDDEEEAAEDDDTEAEVSDPMMGFTFNERKQLRKLFHSSIQGE